MKKQADIDPRLIGTYCIATDPLAGSYRAIIKGCHRGYSNLLRIDVVIVECISPPSDKAIIYRDHKVNRKPYSPGSMQHFAMEQVKLLVEVTA